MQAIPRIPLYHTISPHSIPAIGIGTYRLMGEDAKMAVLHALRLGFRLVDTAASYKNETFVGEALTESGIPRSELFVVVKVPPTAMSCRDAIRKSILNSLHNLRIDYADCVVPHWPGCAGLAPDDGEGQRAARRRMWDVMKELCGSGKIKSLGVSNYLPRHFEEVDSACVVNVQPSGDIGLVVPPAINQVELHPLCIQADVATYCQLHHVVMQHYSPLGQWDPLLVKNEPLREFVALHFPGFSVEDVLLMWGIQQGGCVLVRTASPQHMALNWGVACDYYDLPYDHAARCATTEKSFEELFPAPLTQRTVTAEQKALLTELRDRVGFSDQPDHHFCWYSNHIA